MRLLILSSLFHPEPTANAVRISELAQVLQQAGHEITVLTGFPYYRNQTPDPDFAGKTFVERVWNGIRIIHCYTYVARNRSLVERLKTFQSFALSSILGAKKRCHGSFDGIVAISPPFFTCFSALAISRIKHVPYILDIQDLYPETAIHLGYLRSPLLKKLLEASEKLVYRKACGVIGISEGFSQHFQKAGVSPLATGVIPSWVDLKVFPYQVCRHDPPTQQRPLVLGFFGNHGLAQGLEMLIGGMVLLKNEPRVRLLMIGDGVAKPDLLIRAQRAGLTNIEFAPPCRHDEVADRLREIDVGIVHLRKNPLYKITVPCKTYEYMALGKPVLIGVDGEARTIVENHRAGLFFEPENPADFARAVRDLLILPARLPILSKSGRNAAETEYSQVILGQKYRSFVEERFSP